MGTIPHLLQLTRALPLPRDKVCHTVTTGTVELQDEVLPENDDDDMTYETRRKTTLRIVLRMTLLKKKFFWGEEPKQEYMDML